MTDDESRKQEERRRRLQYYLSKGHFHAASNQESGANPASSDGSAKMESPLAGRGISFSVRLDDRGRARGRGRTYVWSLLHSPTVPRRPMRAVRGFDRGGARPPRPPAPRSMIAEPQPAPTPASSVRKEWKPKSARDFSSDMSTAGSAANSTPAEAAASAPPEDDSIERPKLALHRISDYDQLGEIGKGQFGLVTKAKLMAHRSSTIDGEDGGEDNVVAMKQLRFDFDKEGFPIEALREISLLSSLQNTNIVKILAVAHSDAKDWSLVMEQAGHELGILIRGARRRPFTEAQVKHLMLQLLRGLSALHSVWVMHRDIKPANILVSEHGVLRLCDFGLARRVCCGPELFEFHDDAISGIPLYGERKKAKTDRLLNSDKQSHNVAYATTHTPNVISGHYRPPEVLLGVRDYGRSVDIWSAGCIFGELLSRQVLFAGSNEPDQLRQIFTLLGEPTTWNEYPHLARARGFRFEMVTGQDLHRRLQTGGTELLRRRFPERGFDGTHAPLNTMSLVNPLNQITTSLSNTGFALLCRCLETCPARRVAASDAKRDRWFSSRPVPETLTPAEVAPLLQLAPLADMAGTAPQFVTTGFSNQPLPSLIALGAANFAVSGAVAGAPASVAAAIAIARARALALGAGNSRT